MVSHSYTSFQMYGPQARTPGHQNLDRIHEEYTLAMYEWELPYYIATAYAPSTLLGDSDLVSNRGGHRTEAVASSQLISPMLNHDELGFLVSLSSGASKPYMNFSSLRSLASQIGIRHHSCCLVSAPSCLARIDTSAAI
jgi:hypothetical protein